MKTLIACLVAVLALAAAIAVFHDDRQGPDEDGYLYVVYTDAGRNLDVIDVYESHFENGKATALSQKYRTSDSAGGINAFWKFDKDTGKGPFNAFYAAINLLDDFPGYDADDIAEKRMNTSAGTVAYVLDPYDLLRPSPATRSPATCTT